MRTLRIGQVAESAGVNVQTLRYYERRGLIPRPDRTRAGYRLYPEETVRLVRFIKRAQELGFALAEIEQLLLLRGDHDSSCDEVRALATVKIESIEEKIGHLSALRDALEILVQSCLRDDGHRECPLLESIGSAGSYGQNRD